MCLLCVKRENALVVLIWDVHMNAILEVNMRNFSAKILLNLCEEIVKTKIYISRDVRIEAPALMMEAILTFEEKQEQDPKFALLEEENVQHL